MCFVTVCLQVPCFVALKMWKINQQNAKSNTKLTLSRGRPTERQFPSRSVHRSKRRITRTTNSNRLTNCFNSLSARNICKTFSFKYHIVRSQTPAYDPNRSGRKCANQNSSANHCVRSNIGLIKRPRKKLCGNKNRLIKFMKIERMRPWRDIYICIRRFARKFYFILFLVVSLHPAIIHIRLNSSESLGPTSLIRRALKSRHEKHANSWAISVDFAADVFIRIS